MAYPRSQSAAGGVFIAIGALAGAFIGNRQGQPSLGLLIGFGVGVALALLLWGLDQRRR